MKNAYLINNLCQVFYSPTHSSPLILKEKELQKITYKDITTKQRPLNIFFNSVKHVCKMRLSILTILNQAVLHLSPKATKVVDLHQDKIICVLNKKIKR
ncbi:MAG TPA: hypothetical protein DDW74_05540 [Porphyromonadaceae bacterium]|jgi:uncharacterized protein YoxC|nr:hypothetical protein [Porphyromonadaceae bacterium]HBG80167.1 hypothetical protein [Porphyromonadaceae bacterium]HCF81810.1 hypothetical protein [Porphyromonadaceae bacterium]